MNHIKDSSVTDINAIIDSRISLIQEYKYNKEYIAKENAVFGFSDKIKQPTLQGYYLEKVSLSWPTRGSNYPLECWVKVNCESDFLFLDYNKNNNDIVVKTVNKVISDKLGDDFINKCYWTHSNTVHKLINRATDTSTTYNKKDSDSGWRHTWNL